MLPVTHRLTPSGAITQTVRSGRKTRAPSLLAHVVVDPTSQRSPRVAFAVGRGVGNSVVRHQVTRRLRVAVLELIPRLPLGTDVVIRAFPPAATSDLAELSRDVQRVLGTYLQPVQEDDQDADEPSIDQATSSPYIQPTSVVVDGPVERGRISQALWVLATPLRWVLMTLISTYQRFISPALAPTCRYHPSCSTYAGQAVLTHGVGKGFVLSSWRLLRCNPWTRGGLDPIPPRGRWRPDIYPDGSARSPRAVGCEHEPAIASLAQQT